MTDNEIYDLLDRLVKGQLSKDELDLVDAKLLHDERFRQQVEEHREIANALKFYGKRKAIKEVLTDLEADLPLPHTTPRVIPPVEINERQKISSFKRYWPMVAVAASVALFCIVGTILMTQSMASKIETKQTAIYKELRKNFEQIQKSQNRMMADIAKTNEKPAPLPGRYGGSGFLVSVNGYVVTSHHVVVGADSVYIENPTFGRLKTTVVISDPTNDVAILRIDNPDFKVPRSLNYTVSATEANLGEEVFTLGFPREDIVFGEGAISAQSGYRQNPNAYQVSVPVNPGNSGGPLFNDKGDLVGIISGIQTETLGAAFAIKSTVLLNVIDNRAADSVNAPLLLPRHNHMKNQSRVDQVKKWREHVFVVRVFSRK
jgi:serine protease Do